MNLPHEAGNATRVATWELLPALGFVEATAGPNSVSPGHAYNFGNFTLTAHAMINLHFQPVVLFDGVFASPRTIADVSFELPQEVDSADQAVAMLAYYLDSASRNLKLAEEPEWLVEGRRNQHLLPWEKDRVAYNARPHCRVDRDWVRVALKKLTEQIEHVPAATKTVFSFDGSVLKITCGDLFVAMPAEGQAWTQAFAVPSGSLGKLPTRLTATFIEFEIWNSAVVIGNRRFGSVTTVKLNEKPPEAQE